MITKHRTGYLFKRAGKYYLQYMVDGKRFKQALRNENGDPITDAKKAEAERVRLMAPYTVSTKETTLRVVTHKLDDMAKDREALDKNATPALTIDQAWKVYVDSVSRPDSGQRTLRGYQSQFKRFSAWMASVHPGCKALRDVTAEIAQEYAAYLLREIKTKISSDGQTKVKITKPAYTTNTYNKHIRLLELVFRVLQNQAKMTVNPWSDISRKRENKMSRRELTIEEINKVINKADGELKTLLVVGIYTGLRLGDACTLRWSEVDLVRQIILRVPNKTARRKNQPVHIPIHPTLATVLGRVGQSNRKGYVLPSMSAMYKRNDSDVSKMLRKHFKSCDLTVHAEGTGKGTCSRAVVEVGFHSLRHSFVSLCRVANTPLAVVEAIVGHSNPAMTRHYTHVGDLAASQAVAALPSLNGELILPEKEEGKKGRKASELSERDTKIIAILEASTERTWSVQRDRVLRLIRGA